jgi:hypothetical protein
MRQPILLLLLLAGPVVGPARAQSFGPPVPTELVLVLLSREGNVRFTLSSFYASWQNPFQVQVRTFSNALQRRVSSQHRLLAATPSSPLFEGSYYLSRRWSVGFWYNPIRGERLQETVQVAERFVYLNLQRDTDLADVHVTYHGSRGLSGDRLESDRLNVRLVPFVSLGYHASSNLNRAASVLTGIAVTYDERVSLSTSIWMFDLSNTATRITGGLVILF